MAIKVIRPELAEDAGFRARFAREATAVGRLSHENIVTIHDFDEEDGLLYIVMQFVGTDLGALLRRRERFDTEAAIAAVCQIAAALDAAHAAQIVHRDVKPANVLVSDTPSGEKLLLTDFGLTSAFDARSDETLSGAILGTLDYMAPEYLTGALPGRQGDIYALGVVLYELLTGEVPFAGEDRAARIAAAQRGNRSSRPASESSRACRSSSTRSSHARCIAIRPGATRSAGELAQGAARAVTSTRTVDVEQLPTGEDHLFVSHSHRDGREFAQRLARALRSGRARWPSGWRRSRSSQIRPMRGRRSSPRSSARAGCLFVLTRDSARPGSSCEVDWERALKHGKPVIPLASMMTPSCPSAWARAVVDFREDFDAGVQRLRRRLDATTTDEARG